MIKESELNRFDKEKIEAIIANYRKYPLDDPKADPRRKVFESSIFNGPSRTRYMYKNL